MSSRSTLGDLIGALTVQTDVQQDDPQILDISSKLFGVRTLIVFELGTPKQKYEERVLLIAAQNEDRAIDAALESTREYAEIFDDAMALNFAQSYSLPEILVLQQ